MTFLTVIFRWQPLYRYKIQSSKHLDLANLPRLFSILVMVQVTVFLPVSLALAWVSMYTPWGLWTDVTTLALPSNRALVLHILGYAVVVGGRALLLLRPPPGASPVSVPACAQGEPLSDVTDVEECDSFLLSCCRKYLYNMTNVLNNS